MENENLIFGKNPTKGIVSIEPYDSTAELFIQDENGLVTSQIIPNRYWILSSKKPNDKWRKLDGELHYKYGRQFDSREDFVKARSYLKKQYDIYSIWNPKESLMVLRGLTMYKGLKPKDVSVLSFDLETTTIDLNDKAKILCISNTFRDSKGKITKKLFAYDDFSDEGEMLEAWCKWVCEMNPSIITGHNINSFDFPYLNFRARKFDIELKLGRNGSVLEIDDYESKFRKDGSQDLHYHKCKIFGREICDTLFLAIRYDIVKKKYISYGLKQIIKQEGLEAANRTFYDASTIRKNYLIPAEWAKIKEYCKDDSDDALKLFDLMSPAQFYLTNSIPKSFQQVTESATGSQLNSLLVRSYVQEAHSIPKTSELSKVKGGISFGIPGIYSNVLKIDLKSAYPSQVLRFKLYDPIKDPKAHFYKMVHHFTYERFELKEQFEKTGDKYYYDREQAGKIIINSAYGLMNTPGLNFNNSDIANKITSETRIMIESSLVWSSGKGMEYYKQFMKEEEIDET